MKCVIGIDLGSTTTKAVILDEEERIVGQGITNSRSNYDTACAVARTEALNQARLRLLTDAIAKQDAIADGAEKFGRALDRAFRCEQHLTQLESLRSEAYRVASTGRYAQNDRMRPTLELIFDELKDQAPKLFGPLSPRRSDFFRDIAGSGYQTIAERECDPESLPFDLVLGVYDQAILTVENEPGDLSLGAMAPAALRRAIARRAASGLRPSISCNSAASAASSLVTHSPRILKTRVAISAAAALVKVSARIREGSVPSSSSRTTLRDRTKVLPDPALALTQAEARGREARSCRCLVTSGI